MKCTSRESRSSFETATGHALPLRRASVRAAASWGRRSRASDALARLDLHMLGDNLEPLGLGEPGDGGALRVNAKP